jgi:hypothetical protein
MWVEETALSNVMIIIGIPENSRRWTKQKLRALEGLFSKNIAVPPEKFGKINLICTHAPHEGYESINKEIFCNKAETFEVILCLFTNLWTSKSN